jgi:hypothetical protein
MDSKEPGRLEVDQSASRIGTAVQLTLKAHMRSQIRSRWSRMGTVNNYFEGRLRHDPPWQFGAYIDFQRSAFGWWTLLWLRLWIHGLHASRCVIQHNPAGTRPQPTSKMSLYGRHQRTLRLYVLTTQQQHPFRIDRQSCCQSNPTRGRPPFSPSG